MKRRLGKFGTIFLALALTLGLTGAAFAHWSDYVQIDGTVEMGSVTFAFDKDEFLDYIDNEEITGDKDVGWGEIYYDPASLIQDPHSLKEGYKTLVFVVHNAYPSYEIHFTTVTVHNIGTIPIIITGINVWDPTGTLKWKWIDPPPASPATGFFWKDFDGDGVFDPGDEEIINLLVKNFVGVQLEPCNAIKGEVDLHFKQPAEECHTYKFKITIDAIQWNKA